MKLKYFVTLVGIFTFLFFLNLYLAEAVNINMTPQSLSGEMRIVSPDGKTISITKAGQSYNLAADSRIEIISGSATIQIAGFLVKIQAGESIALKVSSGTGEINLSVLLGDVEIESQQQAWLLNQGETAILPKTDIAVASGEKEVVGATEGEGTSDKVASKAPDEPSLPAGGTGDIPRRLAMPVLTAAALKAPIIVNTPIPSPQPVKYASPSAP